MKGILTRLGHTLHGGPVGQADLEALEGKLYFDLGPDRNAYVRFAVLLVLSTVIAAGGVIGDSTATVIGAMIVAPLMTPIMATALAIVTGDRHHVGRSLLIVVVGGGAVVGMAWLLGLALPGHVDPASNSQVTGRVTPRAIDLLVALACGAAGGFALSRDSVSDALPGVAISISLVPPLCVAGLTLAEGDTGGASGALLLFTTNFLAILVAGGGILAVMGYGAVSRRAVDDAGRRAAAIVTGVAVAIIGVPLVLTGLRVSGDADLEATARRATSAWASGSGYEFVGATADGDRLVITIDGSGPLPPTEALLSALQTARPGVVASLRVVASQRLPLDGTPDRG